MEAYMGTIMIWPMNWAPRDWALCDGTILPINQYSALFALIGTTYGGNGTTNFALPNLCGHMPIGAGQGTGEYLGQHMARKAQHWAQTICRHTPTRWRQATKTTPA